MTDRKDNPYRTLPPRPRLEDLRASHDVDPVHEEDDEELREMQWFLRSAGA